MDNISTSHRRVKLAVGISLYGLALAAGAMEIWNNLLNASDAQSKVIAVLAVVSLMLIPIGLKWLDKGSQGRKALYFAICLALTLTGWSGIKAYTNSQGQHILAVSDSQEARGSSKTDEAAARQDMAEAKREAATARAEAASISEVSSVAALTALVAAASDDLTAAKKQAIEYGTICTKRQSCQALLTKHDGLLTRLGQAQAKADALARAVQADAKAAEANGRIGKAQEKLTSTRSMETSGVDSMIATAYGWDASTVARIDGLAEALLRLALTLTLSMAATPGVLLIGSAMASAPVQARQPAEVEILSPARMDPLDTQALAVAIVNELRRNRGQIIGQNKLAKMIGASTSSVSDALKPLEEKGEIIRRKAQDGISNIIELTATKKRKA